MEVACGNGNVHSKDKPHDDDDDDGGGGGGGGFCIYKSINDFTVSIGYTYYSLSLRIMLITRPPVSELSLRTCLPVCVSVCLYVSL